MKGQGAPQPQSESIPEAKPDRTINARREARFTFAKRRARQIADGMPPLTQEQREELASILNPGRSS